jgi:hypothetical protein
MRAFRFLLAITFLILAFYETSGHHPVIWILVFGLMALQSVLAIFNFFIRPLLAVVLVGFLVYIIFAAGAFIDALQVQKPGLNLWHITPIRYFVYAGFSLLVCLYYLWQSARIKSSFNRLQNHHS